MRSCERTTEAKVVGIARGRAWRTLAGRGASAGHAGISIPVGLQHIVVHCHKLHNVVGRPLLWFDKAKLFGRNIVPEN
jgi:hypothetical protein